MGPHGGHSDGKGDDTESEFFRAKYLAGVSGIAHDELAFLQVASGM
jgi:hypothetical protein